MKWRVLTVLAALAAPACGRIPADPEGTLDRVRSEGVFKVGMIAAGADSAADEQQRRFVAAVAQKTGARPQFKSGPMEPLLLELEEGELDLVIGEMAPKSPWAKQVNLLPPLAEPVDAAGHTHVVAMTRNGENAWIALLQPLASRVRAQR